MDKLVCEKCPFNISYEEAKKEAKNKCMDAFDIIAINEARYCINCLNNKQENKMLEKKYFIWALKEKNEWLEYIKIGATDDLDEAVKIGKSNDSKCWGIRYSISPDPSYLRQDNYWVDWAKPPEV